MVKGKGGLKRWFGWKKVVLSKGETKNKNEMEIALLEVCSVKPCEFFDGNITLRK